MGLLRAFGYGLDRPEESEPVMRPWDGARWQDRARAFRLGVRWSAAYVWFREPEPGTGMCWPDNPDGDRLDEAFDRGLTWGIAHLPRPLARLWMQAGG